MTSVKVKLLLPPRQSRGASLCKLTDCIPVDRAELLEAINAPEVILTGTFIARADVQAFYDVFKRINAKPHFML